MDCVEEKRTINCGDFNAGIHTINGVVATIYIFAETRGRGRNELLIKTPFMGGLNLSNLLTLVTELIERYGGGEELDARDNG